MKSPKHDAILRAAKSIHKEQIKWRRYFHQHPETAFEEHLTTAFIKDKVRKLGLKVLPIKTKTGVLAELKGAKPGPTVAIRSDIDALPVLEASGLPFASKHVGRMHACGHDMHMAAVLGAASLLSKMQDELHGSVRFIFQPAEEQPPGGARPMIENGALKNVSVIFGLHVDPRVPTGKIGLLDGVAMASVTDFDLVIHGRSAHAARPQSGVDAIVTAAEVINSIQNIISREIDPVSPAVITFGSIDGGKARNVICNKVTLKGTARSMSEKTRRLLPKLIQRTATSVCRARGAKAELILVADYPPLKNSPEVNLILARNYESLYGRRKIEETEIILGGEDFACYLEIIPGAMFRLGIKNKKIKADKPWHSDKFIADEDALIPGTALLASAAIDYQLNNGK